MKHLKIQPVGDRILIRYDKADKAGAQTQGGIVIPDSAVEKPQRARVVALGSGTRNGDGRVSPFVVKVGETVLVAKFGGAEVSVDGERYTFVREDDLLGVID
jgi:chaperonin GroES